MIPHTYEGICFHKKRNGLKFKDILIRDKSITEYEPELSYFQTGIENKRVYKMKRILSGLSVDILAIMIEGNEYSNTIFGSSIVEDYKEIEEYEKYYLIQQE